MHTAFYYHPLMVMIWTKLWKKNVILQVIYLCIQCYIWLHYWQKQQNHKQKPYFEAISPSYTHFTKKSDIHSLVEKEDSLQTV